MFMIKGSLAFHGCHACLLVMFGLESGKDVPMQWADVTNVSSVLGEGKLRCKALLRALKRSIEP